MGPARICAVAVLLVTFAWLPATAVPRVICDNDGSLDSYMFEYCLALHAAGDIELLAVVATNHDASPSFASWAHGGDLQGKAARSFRGELPPLIQGVDRDPLMPPVDLVIEATEPSRDGEGAPGTPLLIETILAASDGLPGNEIDYWVSGPFSTLAEAYLFEPEIAERLRVFSIDSRVDDLIGYNGAYDGWASAIALDRFALHYIGVVDMQPLPSPLVPKQQLLQSAIPDHELRRFMFEKDQYPTGLPGGRDLDSCGGIWSMVDFEHSIAGTYVSATRRAQFERYGASGNGAPCYPGPGCAPVFTGGDADCVPGPGCAIVAVAADAATATAEWWRALEQPEAWASLPVQQVPFGGTPHLLSFERIEAEHYDWGGQWNGLEGAYHDAQFGDGDGGWVEWRTIDGVDLTQTSDPGGGGLNVTDVVGGEWLEYTVHAPFAGLYDMTFRVASGLPGRSLRLLSDGEDVTDGFVPVPDTAGHFTDWTIRDLTLPAGTQVLRIEAGVGGFHLNWVEFDRRRNGACRLQTADNSGDVGRLGRREGERCVPRADRRKPGD
ncbi:MAG: carbohydrate-binding protein [bacterium]|nr:carbohydrate-binding protein [bacterium]